MQDPDGMSVAEAAAQLGISKEAVRRRIDRNTLAATKAPDGTWRVHLVTASPHHGDHTDGTTDTMTRDGEATTALLAEKDARIALLMDQIARKDTQISELHVLLQTAQQNEQRLLSSTTADATTATEASVRAREATGPGEGGETPQRGAERVLWASWRWPWRRRD